MMFSRPKKQHHQYKYLIIPGLIAAFMLGRKSEKYGYPIVSRRYRSSNGENKNFEN